MVHHLFTHLHAGVGLMMLQTTSSSNVPSIVPVAITWVKTIISIALCAKGYNSFDEGQDIGDKCKRALPYGVGVALIMSPSIIVTFMPANTDTTFLSVLSTWTWAP